MEGTGRKKIFKKVLQVIFPLLLGVFILVWVYRDFNFQRVGEVMLHGMDYGWIVLSLVFGVFANLFRGWRWKLALEPLGEYPKTSNSVYAIFISYASNLVIPRVGEVTRCGVLSKYDGVSFSVEEFNKRYKELFGEDAIYELEDLKYAGCPAPLAINTGDTAGVLVGAPSQFCTEDSYVLNAAKLSALVK